ncbi:MAG TPA: FAD-dependent oxidoreductase, partial [Firmicutes bacterium]|nr:FAD-dependent oxidoreductase [Bacillota bacterium]
AEKEVILSSGERLTADLLVLAVGTRTNVAPVKESGVEINRGILVDDNLQTSLPGIYAAGDVAETRDLVTGEVGLTPIWPNAVIQGRYAAYNMAGIKKRYAGLVGLQNAVEFREVPAIAMGLSKVTEDEGYEILKVENPRQQLYQKLVLKNNRLQGMILVGDIRRAGVLGALIRTQRDVSAFKDKLPAPGFSYADILVRSA